MKRALLLSIILLAGILLMSGCAPAGTAQEPEPAVTVVAGPPGPVGPAGPPGPRGERGLPGEAAESASTTYESPTLVGSEVCKLCHAELYEQYALSGHNYALNPVVDGQPPTYPYSELPEPPAGYTWDDISYVIGGYNWKARFIDQNGYLITGDAVSKTQYNLYNPQLDLGGDWVAYHPGEEELTFDCAGCHTTDYRTYDHQDDRPGIAGIWSAPGIQCEACHGPGSRHVNNPPAEEMTVIRDSEACQSCHLPGSFDPISAQDGFIDHHDRYDAPFAAKKQILDCVDCHDPHQGVVAPRKELLSTTHTPCEACHVKEARYGEEQLHPPIVECVDCHMPRLIESAVGDPAAHAADMRTHMVQIVPSAVHQFIEDGSASLPFISLEFACQQCHREGGKGPSLSDEALIQKATDYDHQGETHNGEITGDCFRCHDPQDWSQGRFPTAVHALVGWELMGAHGELECSQCHVDNVYHDMAQDCVACHQNDEPHQGQLGQDCAQCHAPNGWSQVTFDHSTAAFQLVGFHAGAACSQCHADLTFKDTPQTCYACHAGRDNHNGQFGQDCAQCHTPSGWGQVTFDHSAAAFQLTGRHTSVNCTQCHSTGVFQGTPQTCYACHAGRDDHNGQFGQNCAQCHNPNGWDQASFDHNQAAFKLTGRHTSVNCAQCHSSGVFQGTPQTCYACHANRDNHNGQFGQDCAQCHNPNGWDQASFDHNQAAFKLTGRHTSVNCAQCHSSGVFQGTPQTCYACHANRDNHNGQFGQDCAQCHNPNGWDQASFDHNQAAFKLTGRHTSVNCAQCHSTGVFQGTPQTCYACHANRDNHNGQFGQNCAQCHNPNGWDQASFDHNLAAFKLTGKHTSVNCGECHSNGVFKGTPQNCSSCHSEPAVHAGKFGTSCETCHTTNGWLPANYNGPHGFPMNHKGANGNCQTCHPSNLSSYTCYGCHNRSEIEKKHDEEGINPSNCVSCHPDGKKPGDDDADNL